MIFTKIEHEGYMALFDGIVESRNIHCKPSKKLTSPQNIDLTERTRQTKEAMPNLEVLGCHCFKHNCRITMMIGVLFVPCRRAVLPPQVNTINTPKHAQPSYCLAHHHQPRFVLLIARWEVLRTENSYQNLCKQPHALECSIFSNAKILVGVVRWDDVRDHPHCCRDILIQTKSTEAGNVPPASEK